jgi:hypothetical protein
MPRQAGSCLSCQTLSGAKGKAVPRCKDGWHSPSPIWQAFGFIEETVLPAFTTAMCFFEPRADNRAYSMQSSSVSPWV